jgi:hypothetical protein
MKQETALRLIYELFPEDKAKAMLMEYQKIKNSGSYHPRSWLQAMFFVAAGGKPLFKWEKLDRL